jgi:hypothetical protein
VKRWRLPSERHVGGQRVGAVDGDVVDAVADEVEHAEGLRRVVRGDVDHAEPESTGRARR